MAIAALILASCATTTPVNMSEPRRLVAAESDVRLDVQLNTDQLSEVQRVHLTYEVTNSRSTPIAIADLVPETTYDPETQMVTIALGSEVPGEELVPRLILVNAGEKKSFSANATVSIAIPSAAATPWTRYPSAVQVKLSFLSDVQPFQQLIGLRERVIHDSQLANELFPKWVEKTESLFTNSVRMRWVSPIEGPAGGAAPGRRRMPE